MDAAVAAVVDPSSGAHKQLAHIGDAVADWCLGHPHSFARVFDALPPPTALDQGLARRSSATFARLRFVVERGVRSREIRVDDVDLEARVGFATPLGVVRLSLAGAAAASGRGATAAATRGRRAGRPRRRARVVRSPWTRPRPARPPRAGRSSRRRCGTRHMFH